MEFWKEESSLYQIIKDHLDQEGYFDPDLIEDQNFVDTYAVLFREPGTSDSYMASMPDRPQEEVGSVIAGALAAYAKNPDSKAEKELYASISSVPFIIYNDYLVDLLSTQEIPDALWNLCHRWLYHAFAPEVLKLAITVTGLHLLNEENLNEVERLHKDLMLLARCEELTSFVVYALELGHLLENEDLWEILTHTRGWGRVCAMSTYDFITPEEKHWLLLHGCDLTVDYPAVALLVIEKSNFLEMLEKERMDDETFDAVLHTMVDYLDFLVNFEAQPVEGGVDKVLELPPLSYSHVLERLLEHARQHQTTLEQVAGLMSLREELQEMIDHENWDYLSMNQCHLYVGTLDGVVMGRDWKKILPKEILSKDGSVNILPLQLADILGIDIHTQVWNLLKKDPMRTLLYPYLLQSGSKARLEKVTDFAMLHLDAYLQDERLVIPLLRGLMSVPPWGGDIIAECLSSLHEGARSVAVEVLEAWPDKKWNGKLQMALVRARELTTQPILRMRIDELLNHRTLEFEDFVNYMKDQKGLE